MQSVTLKSKGVRRLQTGHPWIFESDLKPTTGGGVPPGVVRVHGMQGEVLGQALYNPRSKIALRMLSRNEQAITKELFEARAHRAATYRVAAAEGFEAHRVIHSEADGLPGLTVDRYGDYLVYQQHAAALEPFMPAILEVLKGFYQPRGILARNDSAVRALEGLPQVITVEYGEVPEQIPFREGQITLLAAPFTGQKTGAFLDQRENHVYASSRAYGRALDVFTYHGGFALQLAQQADSVLAVDASAQALEHVQEGARRNDLANVTTRQGDAFGILREFVEAGETFDTIVLDPPAFAKGRSHVERALAGYKEINLQALRLLRPGGRLMTASCSYHVSTALFYDMLTEAAADAGRFVRVEARRHQASCHPEILTFPESHYLKLASLEVVDYL